MRSRIAIILGASMAASLAAYAAPIGPDVLRRPEPEPDDDYHARRLAEDQARSERVARATARKDAEIAAGRAAMEAAEAKRARKNANRLRTRR